MLPMSFKVSHHQTKKFCLQFPHIQYLDYSLKLYPWPKIRPVSSQDKLFLAIEYVRTPIINH